MSFFKLKECDEYYSIQTESFGEFELKDKEDYEDLVNYMNFLMHMITILKKSKKKDWQSIVKVMVNENNI